MPKNSIRDYDATADNNTDIQSVDIDENCSPAGINNAIREVMADLKDVSAGTVALESPQADSLTVTGDLTVDTDTLFVDASANSVGIGNTSPQTRLFVGDGSGTEGITIYSGTTGEGQLRFADGTSGSALYQGRIEYNHSTSKLFFGAGGTTPMELDSGGSLSLESSSDPISLTLRNTSNTSGFILKDYNGNEAQLVNADNGPMVFKTNDTEAMRITSSGRVGIGTASVSGGLHIKGDTNSNGGELYLQVNNNNTTDNIGAITFGNNVDTSLSRILSGTSGANNSSYLTFSTSNTGTMSERMRITSGGNVGIGTTSPAATIDAQSSSSDAFFFRSSNATTTNFYLTNTNATTNNTANFYFAPANNVAGAFIRSQAEEDFSVSANRTANVQFHTRNNGTFSEAMRITPSGNVGIGTTSPTSYGNGQRVLMVEDSSSPAIALSDTGQTRDWYMVAQGSGMYFNYADGGGAGSATNVTEALYLDNGGSVGIGTSSPARQLTVSNSGAALLLLESTGNDNGQLLFGDSASGTVGKVGYQHSTNHMFFNTNDSEAMRIDSSGNLLVGKTSNDFSTEGCILRPNGDVLFTRSGGDTLTLRRNTSNGGIVSFRRDASQVGTITVTTSSTAYNTSSDRRLKENIADADDAGSKFDALQVRKFDWIADGTHQPYGLIAQELEEIEPLAVSTDDTEDAMKSVDYSKLVPMLIKEVQSLRARVAELENA